MKIAVLGTGKRIDSWKKRFEDVSISYVQDNQTHDEYDVFIDLNWDEFPDRIKSYHQNNGTLFILGANFRTIESGLHEFGLQMNQQQYFGLNTFPHLIERSVWEATNPFEYALNKWSDIESFLGVEKTHWLESRVGFYTPRVLSMIINEAYYTLQEGTAEKEAIDTAMKLGTNYPNGPFEFVELLGLDMVYKQLLSLGEDTGEERYRICSLLKQEYLRSGL